MTQRKLTKALKVLIFASAFVAIGTMLGWYTRNIVGDNVRLIAIVVTLVLYLLDWIIKRGGVK